MNKKLFPDCSASVGYQPLINEPDYTESSLFKHARDNILLLPQSKDADPLEWADTCEKKFIDETPCIFVPGSHFDVYGTRHGRGFGWYDRFLSRIPPQWPRIGVLFDVQLSHTRLVREDHDEPVDWLLIKTSSGWHIKAVRESRV